MWSRIDVIEDEVRDLEKVVKADEAILEIETSSEKRLILAREIGSLQYKIDHLREKIQSLSRID